MVAGSVEIIDENRPLDAKALGECASVSEFLRLVAVGWIVLAGMGFPGVEEDRADAVWGVLPRQGIERWRRQRAVGSGQGAELDDQIGVLPEIAQLRLFASGGDGDRHVRRGAADGEDGAKGEEIIIADEFGVVVAGNRRQLGVGGHGFLVKHTGNTLRAGSVAASMRSLNRVTGKT